MKLLLVEDNPEMLTTLSRALGRRGFSLSCCDDGARAIDRWQAAVPDVVVLDLSLPHRDGLQVLGDARSLGLSTPVLILTARGTVGDRVLGLNAGADDYLAKPFDLDELEARLRALGRRRPVAMDAAVTNPAVASWRFGALEVDADQTAVYHDGQVLDLSAREAALLKSLVIKRGQAVSKERLFELIFKGESDVQLEAVEVVAYRLRKKLAPTGVELVTLRGLGYLLKESKA